MVDDPERRARAVLADLEERTGDSRPRPDCRFLTDDVVLIGDAGENFDRAATVSYLGAMADMTPTVRWEWDRVAVVLDAPGLLSFAASGTMGFTTLPDSYLAFASLSE